MEPDDAIHVGAGGGIGGKKDEVVALGFESLRVASGDYWIKITVSD